MRFDEISNLLNLRCHDDLVIITAGPSSGKLDRQSLDDFCKGKFVVAVKQAVSLVDHCDLHVFNDDNYERFDYSHLKTAPLRVYIKSGSRYKRVPKNSYDVIYRIPRTVSSKDQSLAMTYEFEAHRNLFNSDERPFGPGIMYEFCVFLPLYLSSKRVHFFGWDIGSVNDDTIVRFYQKPGLVSKINGFVAGRSLIFYNKIYIHIENIFRIFLFFLNVKLRINVPGITKGEARFIAASTEYLYDFYRFHGVKATVYSETSLISSKFERASI